MTFRSHQTDGTRSRSRLGLELTSLAAGTLLAAVAVAAPASAETYGPIHTFSPGLCVDVRGNYQSNYTPVQMYNCNGSAAQLWTVRLSGSTVVDAYGKCLDVYAGGTADRTPVDIYDCNGTGSQVWIIQSNGAFYNPQSNKCLDDPAFSTTPQTQLEIWDCNGGANQIWSPSPFTVG